MKQLIVIQGPTASGKTALSVAVAQHFSSVIISADSRQFYKEMSIGTAKPSPEEQDGVKHYFIDSHHLNDEISAARYAKETELLLKELFKTLDTVVLTGGSGMFIDALCLGIDDIQTDRKLRDELILEVKEHGTQNLLDELKLKDPAYFEKVDRANPVRIIRAIEVIRITGLPYSQQRTGQLKNHDFQITRFTIEHPREQLYARIEKRVDQMIQDGLVDEVRSLLPYKNMNALQTVGYKELIDYFEESISLEKAIDLVKQHTRNYAKRQMTWFKKHSDAIILPFTDTSQMLETIIKEMSSK